jgi:hypothetical protein
VTTLSTRVPVPQFRPYSALDGTPAEESIPGLLYTHSSIVVVSGYLKSGRTSLVLNLANAMTTDDDFLGGLPCKKVGGPVVYVSFAMNQVMIRQYIDSASLKTDNDLLLFADYHGRAQDFRLMDATFREVFAAILSEAGASAVIIDPLPVLLAVNGIDTQDISQVARATAALSSIAEDAALDHLVVVDTLGHGAKTRSRGASELASWGDVLWDIRVDSGGSPYRVLSAVGRGIDPTDVRYLSRGGRLALAARHEELPAGGVSTTGKILAVLHKGPRSVAQLHAQVGTTAANIANVLHQQENLGNVIRGGKAPGKGGFELWQIAERF